MPSLTRSRVATADGGGGSPRSGARARRRPRRGRARACARRCLCSSASAQREVVEEVAGAHVDDERVAGRLLAPARELGDLADEHRRQVVDHEEAEVFEHVGRLGAPAPDMPVMIVTSRPERFHSAPCSRVEAVQPCVHGPRRRLRAATAAQRARPRRAPAASSPSRTA